MPDRRRFAIAVTPLFALIAVAAAVLLPSGAAPAAAQSTDPAAVCFEITVGWRICVAPAAALAYTTYDPTGQATTPGSYAFLDPTGNAVTTYEALRDGTATGLRVHQSDGYGASQAGVYDAVAVGDIFEWREADDCFVRYEVTEVKADPAGTAPRKDLTIEWMTYAFTGCSGAVAANTAASFAWGDLPDLGGPASRLPSGTGPSSWSLQVGAAPWRCPKRTHPRATPPRIQSPPPTSRRHGSFPIGVTRRCRWDRGLRGQPAATSPIRSTGTPRHIGVGRATSLSGATMLPTEALQKRHPG